MSGTLKPVVIVLRIVGATDRDPWEWADGIAHFLRAELNENNGPNFPEIVVAVDDVEGQA